MMQDQELIVRFQEGDFDAFGDLYERYIDRIFAFILRKTSDRQVAEDLTSQVWMKTMKGLSWFSSKKWASFRSWIYRIAQNTVIDYYRTKKQDIAIDEMVEIWFSLDIEKYIDDRRKLQEVQEFLRGLKKIEQEIVILRVWDELSYREIAEITGKKEDNCKQIFGRTLKKIRAHIIAFFLIIILL